MSIRLFVSDDAGSSIAYLRALLVHDDDTWVLDARANLTLNYGAFALAWDKEDPTKFWTGRGNSTTIREYQINDNGFANQISTFSTAQSNRPVQGLEEYNDILYVINAGGVPCIHTYQKDGTSIASWPTVSGNSKPRSLTVNASGIWAVDQDTQDTAFAYTLAGVENEALTWTFTNPVGSAVQGISHREGHFYLAFGTGDLYRIADADIDYDNDNTLTQMVHIPNLGTVRALTSKPYDPIRKDVTVGYIKRKQVLRDLTIKYQKNAFMKIMKDLTIKYVKRQQIVKDLTVKYTKNVFAKIMKDLTTKYVKRQKIISDLSIGYDKHERLMKDVSISYSKRVNVVKDLTIDYTKNAFQKVMKDVRISYAKLQQIVSDVTIPYAKHEQVVSDRDIGYAKLVRVVKDRTVKYSKWGQIVKDVKISYGKRVNVLKDVAITYSKRLRVGVDKTISYAKLEQIVKDLTIAYQRLPIPKIFGFISDQFMTDLISMLENDDRWGGVFGVKPSMSKVYHRKIFGLGQRSEEAITIFADKESINPFSLGLGHDGRSWKHDVTATIRVVTNVSEVRFAALVEAVVDILKRNVIHDGYVQIEITGFTNTSDETRNEWSGVVDVGAMKVAPSRGV